MQHKTIGVALITGASRGIGRALAEQCAMIGYDLALVALPGEDLPDLAIELAGKYKVEVRTLETSLADPESADRVLEWVQQEDLNVSMLINNAGLGSVGPFAETDRRKHRAMITLNMYTPYLLMRGLMPILQTQRQAYVINISSQASFFPIPYKATYSATKAFLMYLSLGAEYEMRGSNVHVAVVCPSGVLTSPEIRERIRTGGLLAKLVSMEPEEVAKITLTEALKKKRFIVPGTLNRISYYATFIVPDFLRMAFISRKMRKTTFDAPETAPLSPHEALQKI
jgi:uncharacterized protein